METSNGRRTGTVGRSRQLRQPAAHVRRWRRSGGRCGGRWRCRQRRHGQRLRLAVPEPIGSGSGGSGGGSGGRIDGPVLPASGGRGRPPETAAVPPVPGPPVHGRPQSDEPHIDVVAAAQLSGRSEPTHVAIVGVGRTQLAGRRFGVHIFTVHRPGRQFGLNLRSQSRLKM